MQVKQKSKEKKRNPIKVLHVSTIYNKTDTQKEGGKQEEEQSSVKTVTLQRQRRPTEFKHLNSVLQRHSFIGHFAL